MTTDDDPVRDALAARLGEQAATELLDHVEGYSNYPRTVEGVAAWDGAADIAGVDAAALAVVEDLALLGPLGFGVHSDPADRRAARRFWGLLTLAARADPGVLERVLPRFAGQRYADDLVATIRTTAAPAPVDPGPVTARPRHADPDTLVDGSPAQVLRVVERMVDLPWPEPGADDPLQWERDGLEGHTLWLAHVLPLAAGAEAADVAALVVPLVALADQRWHVRHRFDATAFTDDASTDPASYDRRSAPAAMVRSLGAEHAVWWPLGDDAALLVDTSGVVPAAESRAVVLVLPARWLTAPDAEEASLQLPLVQDLLSDDGSRVMSAVWDVLGTRDPEVLEPLLRVLPTIKEATQDLELGGALIANASHVARALDRVALFGRGTCLCTAYLFDQLSDPAKEERRGHVRIVETIPGDGSWVPDRICECTDCGRRYRVEEGLYHYPWWAWTSLDGTEPTVPRR
ncbi:hypothetical protein [Nocardioides plantarum]|uniref:Uncharacterized protein n=1 Tax=Nocardioides plantarum TaxID=29299 RepID=A0ABV5K9H5_9ACTN|nr:hypothetical protein [Nocardioides plantarum]